MVTDFQQHISQVIFGRFTINFNVKYKELMRTRKKKMIALLSKIIFCASKREFSVTSRHFVVTRGNKFLEMLR
jgi:hypothetical protein